ncbi:hypothetical protein [Burkholderia lata]|uniref:hypothetical protein n=1 Tax=Burkholderia lata (strain ATCC 17760 / DSM 23089 / LMG 22485 / NCIMB 9086 / R18194 / 383) TaxID=482957 RepID=UPI0014531122|nr:hypothetical protein [Burkholderia lata]VWL89125.1 hypothetical protein BLA6992_00612 [Burkholderia lata]
MTDEVLLDSSRLPEGFDELESFPDRWNATTSHERWIKRAARPNAEVVMFYDEMSARVKDAAVHLERFPPDDIHC